ncbi:phage portal protein [Bacillus mycoides]|uniref:phage portal protein n=1 Tax=Bacillus mycoides TaxID=1405 RepID=UPI0003312C7B|nr:phage portal protein [Bacillus mycoides]EOO35068.1 HK97 family phage portal protein [Bacillus mycoides]
MLRLFLFYMEGIETMGFLNLFEKRSTEEKTTIGGVEITPNSSFGGMVVNEKTVTQIATAEACLNLTVKTVSGLPINLHKENADGSIEKVLEDKRVFLLNDENETFMKGLVKDYLLYGQAFLYKRYDVKTVLGEPMKSLKELNYLSAKDVAIVNKYHDGIKYTNAEYQLTTFTGQHVGANERKIFHPDELLRVMNIPVDDFEGEGLLKHGDKLFKQALAEIEYTNGIYDRGALPLGILKTTARLSQVAVERLREAWAKLYSGVKNSAKTVILEEGMSFDKISMNPNEIQMNETMSRTDSKICTLFGVPESLISTKANKYNTVGQNSLHFLKHTIGPILVDIEKVFNKELLTEKEKLQGYYFRFDTSELLRTTEKERTESVALGLEKGLLTINEARAKLDLPKIKNDLFIFGLQHALYNPETNEWKVPNIDGGTLNQEKGNDVTHD